MSATLLARLSHEMHVNLARIHIDNRRFTAICERIHEGMARYRHNAIVTNAARSR